MARSSKLNRTLSIALSLVLATTFGLPVAAWASGGAKIPLRVLPYLRLPMARAWIRPRLTTKAILQAVRFANRKVKARKELPRAKATAVLPLLHCQRALPR